MKKAFFKYRLLILFFSALFLRLVLSFFGTYEGDFYTFIGWSFRLVSRPLPDFYKEWSDYLPGYLYILYILGRIRQTFAFIPNEILYKFPAIFSDLLAGLLVYKIVAGLKNKTIAFWVSIAYLFNPAVFANSTLWGQVDSLTVLFPLLSLYFFNISLPFSSFFLAFGALVKVQAALAFIPIIILFWRKGLGFYKLVNYGTISVLTITILFLPFLPFGKDLVDLPSFILERIGATLGQYPYLSVNAFNFWGLSGFWEQYSDYFPNIFPIFILLFVSFLPYFRARNKEGLEYVVLSLVFAVSFLFFPRMHERHMLPLFAPLAISCAFYPLLWIVYSFYSFFYLLNLRYAFVWLTEERKEIFTKLEINLIIVLLLVLFVFWLWVVWQDKRDNFFKNIAKYFGRFRKNFSEDYKFPKFNINSKRAKFFLILILVFAFFSRVYQLGRPQREYFDEVYHAFTARLMLKGDPKAWEWWNPHPEGFAYEWSHPPLAKLGMQLGMLVFGENAFGWRLPAALLGTLSVLLVYLLAKEIFKDYLVGLFSALVFSLDGLFLVASRIGMNDIYVLFFSLLSIYLFIKDKYFFSALALGLAFSSKWSALWVLPILVSSFFVFKKRVALPYLWFLVLPPLVYVSSYTQMFLTGHSFDIFWGVQKQMWWYHTGLEATHPYTSPWWSWPFLLRPVWLYTNSFPDGKVANIYFLGNPVVFWFGVLAVFYSLYLSWKNRFKKLAWVIFSYFVFFVPWAVAPRIMFLYHYLPSVPFMSMVLGFVLRRDFDKALIFFTIAAFVFAYFYPHLTGIPITKALDISYYWFDSWR